MRPPGESDHIPSESAELHAAQEDSHTPSGDSAGPPLKTLERLRRIPRSRWLALAIMVLVSASVFWYRRLQTWDTRQAAQIGHSPALSPQWWSEPVVYNPDAALPEISGRLFGVAVQKVQGDDRIWVVGAKGFLAYSDDAGQCWTRFDYHPDLGVFREVTSNPCPKTQSSQLPDGKPKTLLEWPRLVPTVYAGEPPKMPSPRQQSLNPALQSPVQPGPAQPAGQQSSAQQYLNNSGARQSGSQQFQTNAPEQQSQSNQAQQTTRQQSQEARSPIALKPNEISLGTSESPLSPKDGPAALSRPITVVNLVDNIVHIKNIGFLGNEAGEWQFSTSKCDSGIGAKRSCELVVSLRPKADGKKEIKAVIATDYSPVPATVYIHAFVSGFFTASNNNPEKPPIPGRQPSRTNNANAASGKLPTNVPATPSDNNAPLPNPPKPPPIAPDLLAISIGGLGEPRIISTGGALWTINESYSEWSFRSLISGRSIGAGGRSWTFSGPPSGWATETRVETIPSLAVSDDSLHQIELRWDTTNRTGMETQWRSGSEERVTQWPDSRLQSAAFDSNGRTWVAGWSSDAQGDHAVLAWTSNGAKWLPLTRGALNAARRAAAADSRAWMWMPRWYLAMLLLSLFLAAPALLRPLPVQPSSAEQNSVEGRLSSDKPLDPGDRDVLGLTEIALGLSAFLRNEKTLPPLTIAINGEWGTGKSSLMNLLCCDLKSYGMRPVWFNAWHHQKEEHLLAALLQTIKLEAVPRLWDLLGVPFRARLIAYRLRRRWPVLVMAGAMVTFLVMLDYHFRIHDHKDLFQWVVNQIVPSLDVKSNATTTLPLQGGLIALLTAITALWKGLTAFGANPASLLASVAQGNKMKDLEAQTSFRQKFAEEFRDFTNALGDSRPLVIFIDDLDRCLPANVRDVLEAVNFLVSSGDCFVVLGMDRVQVQRAVGLSFKDVAEEAGPNHARGIAAPVLALTPQAIADSATEAAREKRAEFAQRYLEKLVNLEIRVPLAEDDDVKQRLFEKDPPPRPITLKEKSLQAGLKTLRWGIPASLVVLLLWGSYHYSRSAAFAVERWMAENPEPVSVPPSAPNPAAANSAAPTGGQPASTTAQSRSATKPAPLERSTELVVPIGETTPVVLSEKAVWPARWMLSLPLYLGAVFLLLVANVVLTTRPGVITQDSQQFTDAMGKVWYPLVLEKQNTPRAAKRFVNRVRYLAMRQRYYRPEDSLWQRTLFPERLASPAHTSQPSRIPEPIMIALAAMEQSNPAWVYDPAMFKNVVDGKDLPEGALRAAREGHIQEFSNTKSSRWALLPSYREAFLRIWPRLAPEEPEERRLAAAR